MTGLMAASRRNPTRAQNAAMAAAAVWIVVAVYLDGRAHVQELPESFFTWWHALLYSGFVAALAVLVVIIVAGRTPGRSLLSSLACPPNGYRGAVAGAVVFGLGGLADMLWHTVFGVEQQIDALLSPSHLLLFVGGVLLFSGPVLSGRVCADEGGSWPGSAVVAVAAITAVVAFATSYLSAFTTDAPLRVIARFPEGTPEHYAAEAPAVIGVASYLVTSLIIVMPLVYLLWSGRRVPVGTITGLVTSLAVLAALTFDFTRPAPVVAVFLGAAVAEVGFALTLSLGVTPRTGLVALAGALPVLVWSAQLAALQITEGLGWSAEFIAGTVVLCALVAAGVVVLVDAMTRPGGDAYLGQRTPPTTAQHAHARFGA